jgi:hypothetical protein
MVADNLEHFSSEGLYYPETGRVTYGQHNLAWELSGDKRFQPQAGSVTDLCAELERVHPPAALLSSEDFECLYSRTDRLIALRQAMEGLGYAVVVVVTLREPAQYIVSLYFELQKHGLTEDFDSFIEAAVQQRGVIFSHWDLRLDYSQLIRGFAGAFGSEALRVLRYEPTDAVAPVLRACSEAAGLRLTPVVPWGRSNVSNEPGPDILSEAQRESVDAAFEGVFEELVGAPPQSFTSRSEGR